MGPADMAYAGGGHGPAIGDLYHTPLNNSSPSVNEVEDPDEITCSVWLENACLLVAPPTQEVDGAIALGCDG